MDPRQITRLAKLLRENGDKVLNSEYKLTLTGALLRALNDSFSLIADPNEVCTPQTFLVLKPNNAKSDVFRELQVIYDFVQKTQILCLTTIPNDDAFDGLIDISKFRNLKRLEIQRIPIEQIVGIQRLRAHLQELICSKSINKVQDIISHCGGDKANGFLWNELKMADFSYNCLKTIDCSLEFASNLQQLNLSHNQIVSVDAIKWLPNLKKLNLSYNSLTHIPQSIAASRRLQTLVLTNNFIEDLCGLPRLEALNELNLADNCILDHAVLPPLSTLIALQNLQLHGNPISCHPNHREETAKYLHKNTVSVKFFLDGEPQNKYEKNLTGQYAYMLRIPKNLPFKRSSGQSTPIGKQTNDNTPASSVGSFRSYRIGVGSSCSTTDTPFDLNESMSTSVTSVTTQKKMKVRPAIIDDDDEDKSHDAKNAKVKSPNRENTTSFQTNDVVEEIAKPEHLETKKQIEEIRKEYGDSWLHSKGATKVQNVMGIRLSFPKSDATNSFKSPSQMVEQMIDNIFSGESSNNADQNRTSTPINRRKNGVGASEVLQSPIEFQSPASTKSDYQSVSNSDDSWKTMNSKPNNTTTDETPSFQSAKEVDPVTHLYEKASNEPELQSDPEDNEAIYIVKSETNHIDLLVIISDQSIREKNALTAKTIAKWNMDILESCEQIRTDVLRLRFDTRNRDKRQRIYHLKKGEGQELNEILRNILSRRPLSEMKLSIFRCANCSTQFSRERLFRKIDVKCPECNSTYVMEIKEQTPSPPQPHPQTPLKLKLEKCESRTSIAPRSKGAWIGASIKTLRLNDSNDSYTLAPKYSASSFNECSTHSKISRSQSSFDSNQSLLGSTTNCDHTNNVDLDLYFASRFGAPAESDIEILSNPSISSIEVLEHFSRHSSRKQSEDRRYLLQTQLYVQQHQQFTKSIDAASDLCRSSSFDIGSDIISNSNSDIEEILDEPLTTTETATATAMVDQVTITDDNGLTMAGEIVEKDAIKPLCKKTILTGMNLTESSSSGSVTDSVCTAYENQPGDSKNLEISAHNLTITTSTATTMTPIERNSPKLSEEKALETSKSDETSAISTMFGGLFNSTNLLMSRTAISSPAIAEPPCNEFKFSYSDFGNVDHRLKLFLYQNIFEDANEHLKWLVRGRMFNDSMSSDPEAVLQSAIFVMSTTKWYVFNVVGRESDDIGKWLKRHLFGTIDRVETVRVLPWKIGITFNIKFFGSIHFFLQDIIRTDSLLLFFANNPLPLYCSLEYQISERISQKLLKITDNVQLNMLAILNECQIIGNDSTEAQEYCAFIITDTHLYVTKSKYSWLSEKLDQYIDVAQTQLMTNLVDIEKKETDNSLTINFLDEIQDRNESWKCVFETDSCLESTFAAIAQPWEKVFGVRLAN